MHIENVGDKQKILCFTRNWFFAIFLAQLCRDY